MQADHSPFPLLTQQYSVDINTNKGYPYKRNKSPPQVYKIVQQLSQQGLQLREQHMQGRNGGRTGVRLRTE